MKLKAFLGVARRLFFTLSHFTKGSLFRNSFWTGKVDSRFGQSVTIRFFYVSSTRRGFYTDKKKRSGSRRAFYTGKKDR